MLPRDSFRHLLDVGPCTPQNPFRGLRSRLGFNVRLFQFTGKAFKLVLSNYLESRWSFEHSTEPVRPICGVVSLAGFRTWQLAKTRSVVDTVVNLDSLVGEFG